jgi:hypothetical protein
MLSNYFFWSLSLHKAYFSLDWLPTTIPEAVGYAQLLMDRAL